VTSHVGGCRSPTAVKGPAKRTLRAVARASDAAASTPADDATGLAHVALKIGSSAGELRLARRVLETERIPVLYEAERKFTRSLHVLDPDGNEIELYVDLSDA
jgi:catechol-2,3-dioxygenase